MNQLNAYRSEPFNQTNEIRAVLTRPKPNGFGIHPRRVDTHEGMNGCCLSLCFQWMKLKMTNSKESAQDRITKIRATIPKVILRQKLQSELWAVGGGEANYTAPATYIGVKLKKSDLNREKVKPNLTGRIAFCELLRNTKKTSLLMDYRWPDDSGHAVAWYVSSGKVFNAKQHIYFFDPNFGEYKVLLKDRQDFVTQYFAAINRVFRPNPVIGYKDKQGTG